MAREDLEHVGKRYFTSKCSTLEDLENLQFHGFRGEAVASIASLSTLVEIASRSRLSSKTFVKIFKDGKGMDVFESEVNRPSVGTTVVICNFFHNMPVRRKRVDVVLECERIRHRVEAISLMHPSISFTLKNDCTGTMVVQLPKAKSIYYRFVQIHGMSRAQKLADICCSYGQFEMSGYIGREGHYNCGLQFLFVNGRLVLKTRIHKLLNFLLKRINVSGRHNGNSGEPLTIGSPRQRAGAEVHGVYIINIKCHYSEYDICLEPAKTLIEFKDWDSVLSCVEKGIREFLTRENLVTELSPEDVCKYVHGNYFIEPIGSTLTVDGNAAKTLCNAEELYDGHKLMSAAVHRILKLDSERTESVQKDYEDNIVNEEPVHRMVVEDFDMTKNVHVDNRYNMVYEEANFAKKELSLCCDTTMEQNKQGESIAVGSSDWLEHFDDSIGKLVYINKVTGLSKYEAPAVEETPVPCTTDVTTMSVGVISRNDDVKADTSLSSMFSEWSNPVFARPPEVAVNVTSGQAEGLAVKIHNILYPYRFTKNMIHSMKVVNQVDKKFIACLINTKDVDMECGNLLVLVDQHAAHERVRLENLIMESYEDDPETPGQRRLCSSSVTPPVEIEVTEEEHRLLRSCQPFLIGLGLELRFAETGDPRLLVGKVPVCFVEREVSELRRGRQSATKAIVEEYIREQIELLQSAGRVRGTLPLTVLKVLASQACHGAVKFNHNLSMEECCSLVGSLSTCQLPFQCAHGRPSMVPLADLLHLDNSQQESPKPNLRKLRQMYRAWELYGKT
ncbi:hypothetical protein GJAV_G00013160 [Gymnothorax javanicus]|nr:hypothetical protein GJAV_G00013160 [Gymnothorax javanicus]